ncbi:MAG: mechanosensitive ion channel family protein [Verrucomicrobiota bacterium]|nr:mechanosensitive ion channel family protein [Verrucomicrobiota bacterium]
MSNIAATVTDILIKYGFQILGAIIVMLVGYFLSTKLGALSLSWLQKKEMEPPVRMLIVRVVRLLVLLLTIVIALDTVGVPVGPLIAGIGVAGVGVGFALQGVLSNFFAGLFIIFTKPFRVGEFIDLLGEMGQVSAIDLFSTKLAQADKSVVVIPNRKIIGEILHNYGMTRQVAIELGVAYNTDINHAIEVITSTVKANAKVLKEHDPAVFISTLADSSMVISVRAWCALSNFPATRAELMREIVTALKQHNIQIPFPQREIRILNAPEAPGLSRVA